MTHEVATLARAGLVISAPMPNQKRPSQGYIAFALLVAFICAAFLIASAQPARAGVNVWTTHGPYGGSVHALAIAPHTPSTTYAGTDDGVFKSTDSGATWNAVNTGLPNPYQVAVLAIDPSTPSTLYAAGGSLYDGGHWGVFKSTNSGATWNAVNTGLPNPYQVAALAIDPSAPSTLYAGGHGGVFQSTDSGANWNAVNTGLPTNYPSLEVTYQEVAALAIDPRTPSTLYAAAEACGCSSVIPGCFCNAGGVFRSTNSGGNWAAVNSGWTNTNVIALAIDPTTPSTLYAGTGGCILLSACSSGVFQSTDSGTSWNAVNTGLPTNYPSLEVTYQSVAALAIDPRTTSTLYTAPEACGCPRGGGCTCNAGGVFRSTNGGGNWAAVNTGLTDLGVSALAIDPTTPSTLYAGTAAGVFDIELTCVVGTGTSASCSESALDACLPGGAGFNGAVTFSCSASLATITVTSTKTISADTTIDGGNLITISGGGTVQVFVVNEGVSLNLHGVIISGGRYTGGQGGAINNSGTLTVTDSTFSGNLAASGGAVDSSGGAIANSGTLTVANSTFSGNSTALLGGGIYNGGTLTVTNSTFSGNSATYGGGAIYNSGTLTVTNSTFSGNSAPCHSVPIPACIGSDGGAIANAGTLTVTNSTFSGNSATGAGGAVDNTTTCGDTGSAPCSATLSNTIVANSTSGENCAGMITDSGHNLDSDGTCGVGPVVDPLLDSAGLADNGGPTQTIALQAHSPAINAGDETICAAPAVNDLDQRGYARPGTGYANCSVGAYEYNSSGPPAPTFTPTATPTASPPPSVTPSAPATSTRTLTPSQTPTSTTTATPMAGGGGGGGCAITPTGGGGAGWWLLACALVLARPRRTTRRS